MGKIKDNLEALKILLGDTPKHGELTEPWVKAEQLRLKLLNFAAFLFLALMVAAVLIACGNAA